MDYENHHLTILASLLCFAGVVWLACVPAKRARLIYESATFLPTYTVGIVAWLMHGLNIHSTALIIPCALQLLVLLFLIRRAFAIRSNKEPG